MAIDFTKVENQHPALRLFPLMPEAELKELAADIKQNGQQEEIIIYNDLLIDGQNRLAACNIAGLSPKFHNITWTWNNNKVNDADIVRFVLSKNLKRRQLTPAQRGSIVTSATTMLDQYEQEARDRQRLALAEEARRRKIIAAGVKEIADNPDAESIVKEVASGGDTKGRTREKIAKLADISESLAADLIAVKKHAPDLMPEIAAGTKSVNEALWVAKRNRDEIQRSIPAKAKKKPAKPKVDKVHGIFKKDAILLGEVSYMSSNARDYVRLPVLITVLEVKNTKATCKSDLHHGDLLVDMDGKSSSTYEGCITMPVTTISNIRAASKDDIKMVERVRAAVRGWK